jgi:hypothetical protein
LRKGAEPPIQPATRTAEAALEAVENSIRAEAAKEKWMRNTGDKQLEEIGGPVQELLMPQRDNRKPQFLMPGCAQGHAGSMSC